MRGKRVQVGKALEELLERKGRRSGGARLQAQIDDVWDGVVGEEIARHTRGIGVKGRALRVSVDSHAWAAQLTYMATQLKEKLNAELGSEAVGEIRFSVSRVVEDERRRSVQQEDARRRYGGDVVEPVPLTVDEVKQVEEEAAGIRSDKLRQAAIRARVREIEWKKGIEAAKGREEPPHGA